MRSFLKRNSAERVFKKSNSFLPRPMKKSADNALMMQAMGHDSVEDIENADVRSDGHSAGDSSCENCNGNFELPNLKIMKSNHDDDDDDLVIKTNRFGNLTMKLVCFSLIRL